jgi:hypothetical protein
MTRDRDNLNESRGVLDYEIDPVMCILFVVIVFLLVPFTLLSPFRYPQPSVLDKFLAVNSTEYAPRPTEAKLSGKPILDLSLAATADQSPTGSVRR